jgi:hypothetical protein
MFTDLFILAINRNEFKSISQLILASFQKRGNELFTVLLGNIPIITPISMKDDEEVGVLRNKIKNVLEVFDFFDVRIG